MKTMKIKMASLFWIFGLLWISLNGNGQNNKLTREERKEVRKAEMAANFNIIDSLLRAKSFVLEADFLVDKYGYRVPVTSALNFVKVDESQGILQTGSNTGTGYNGVGGTTAQGSIGVWKIDKDFKHLSFRLRFNMVTNIGIYDIFLSVTADNHATATISGLVPGKLTWEGHLATVNNSNVFKGMNII